MDHYFNIIRSLDKNLLTEGIESFLLLNEDKNCDQKLNYGISFQLSGNSRTRKENVAAAIHGPISKNLK